ncbi:hypothetical protein [Helicobacter brantae]|uniref:Uncharacterized protein n=1 Tax=Helicobacter brantae TaxID=375927 RepID=A0A3D8IZN1_9HELI|nr:hypothetical protein [Helicobacter brantae]RDU70543.1 hypothetical protein CQA58_05060 [Helicobacter brantae]
MDTFKFWVIPFITFGIFICFAIGILIYTYSDLQVSFSQEESTSSVTTMQNFQEAMGSQLK